MALEIKAFTRLVEELMVLPGIGRKSAQRIAFFLIKQPEKTVQRLSGAIGQIKEKIIPCRRCNNYSEDGLCSICGNPDRRPELCIVEEVGDLMAIERMGEFKGKYHVLNGVISPLDGIGPEDLAIGSLINRIETEAVQEVVLATNFTVEGEATAMYLARLLKPKGVKVYRLAHGLPVGGSLEYADEATMSRALEGKLEI